MTTSAIQKDAVVSCHHCGEKCNEKPIVFDEYFFCCSGCQTVYEILKANNLCGYYDLDQNAGISLKAKNFQNKFDYLLEERVQDNLLNFRSENLNKIILYLPAVHCSSCVWLLENFKKIRSGIVNSRLDFIKKELAISYDPTVVHLKEIVSLLATLGYEPQINLASNKSETKKQKTDHSLIFKIGVVGFCFGNIMLLSFPEYFKMDVKNTVDAAYQRYFLYLNFLLSLPVFFYGASDYLLSAQRNIQDYLVKKSNTISVDIPIALGITALFCRSLFETLVNQTAGYWDSLAGLVFFLLIGKWVQQITFSFLSFERNYTSYFPLAVKVSENEKEYFKNVNELLKGDTQLIHNQEIIPTDSILLSEEATVDYSFVTGESVPVKIKKGTYVYAGGRQVGKSIKLRVEKSVSHSYLTQLWNDDSFKKEKITPKTDLSNLFSKYFTFITLGIATLTGLYWFFVEPTKIWLSVTAVLMVACPCALTLSMPFTMNAVLGIFGRNKFYVKNQGVIQLMNEIDTLIFDKTGTLTENSGVTLNYIGVALTEKEIQKIALLASQSTHPLSKIIVENLGLTSTKDIAITNFSEINGKGISGIVNQDIIQFGSAVFIDLKEASISETAVHVKINGKYKGYYSIESGFRSGWKNVLKQLKNKFTLGLLSGDNAASKSAFDGLIASDYIRFNQKPVDKLEFIKKMEAENHKTIMVGDGLNDAGALRQATIGIAISEDAHAFSPACDAILEAKQFRRLPDFLNFSKTALKTVRASFVLSVFYNIICIGWAASGNLSPVFAAIFMPLSTISVVLFAVGLTYLLAYRKGFLTPKFK